MNHLVPPISRSYRGSVVEAPENSRRRGEPYYEPGDRRLLGMARSLKGTAFPGKNPLFSVDPTVAPRSCELRLNLPERAVTDLLVIRHDDAGVRAVAPQDDMAPSLAVSDKSNA